MDDSNITTTTAEEITSDVMDGWDSYGEDYTSDSEETTEEQADQPESEEPETEGEEDTADDTGEDAKTEGAEESESEPDVEEPFSLTIRYMGQDETISSKAEAIILAQKGRNYDAVYQRMKDAEAASAQAQAEHDFLQSLADKEAKSRGLEAMSTQDYIDAVQIRLKVSAGMSEAQAKRELDLEKREASVAQKEKETEAQKPAVETERERVAKDKEAFLAAFPDVAINDIPQEVWQTMANTPGTSLAIAYAKWLAGDAKAKLAEAEAETQSAKQREDAAKRTPGSMRNNNPKPKKSKEDEFLAGWEF